MKLNDTLPLALIVGSLAGFLICVAGVARHSEAATVAQLIHDSVYDAKKTNLPPNWTLLQGMVVSNKPSGCTFSTQITTQWVAVSVTTPLNYGFSYAGRKTNYAGYILSNVVAEVWYDDARRTVTMKSVHIGDLQSK